MYGSQNQQLGEMIKRRQQAKHPFEQTTDRNQGRGEDDVRKNRLERHAAGKNNQQQNVSARTSLVLALQLGVHAPLQRRLTRVGLEPAGSRRGHAEAGP